jgi:hypothetical protein
LQASTGVRHPDRIAIDRFGQFLVSDGDNNRVLVFDAPLSDTTADQVISNAPSATASDFAGPKGLTVDEMGNHYVSDRTTTGCSGSIAPDDEAKHDLCTSPLSPGSASDSANETDLSDLSGLFP